MLDLSKHIGLVIEESKRLVSRSINSIMVLTYFEIGRLIVESEQGGKNRAEYGKSQLKNISIDLTDKFGKGYSVQNLERMRLFYITYKNRRLKSSTLLRKSISKKKSSTAVGIFTNIERFNLSWSHYLILTAIDIEDERNFYEKECEENNWSVRELKRQVNSALYQRIALSTDKQKVKELAKKGHQINNTRDIVKDPYVLEFLNMSEKSTYSESELEQALIDKLEHFLLELGKGYTFVARQKRISFDDKHFYIDLVFYNRILKCFVIIDLKIGELTHQDIGQIQMYVNYYDRYVKLDEENKTIGIILSQVKNDMLVEITLPENNKQIFASKYQMILPNKEQFRELLEN